VFICWHVQVKAQPQFLDAQVLLTLEDDSDFGHEAAAASKSAGHDPGWLPVGIEEEADMTPTDLFFRLHISRSGANA
jgi:hypothetical protein